VRAFVTGGSGYLGGHLIGALVAQSHAVRALARSDDAAATVTGHGAKAVRGDLLNADAMAAGMKGCAVAYHCAALAESRALPEHPLSGYPSTKGAAERLVLQANCAALATVIVRPRLIWGKDDPKILPRLVEASDLPPPPAG
jgi:nucleoside-diphosphate-sugar epimerase